MFITAHYYMLHFKLSCTHICFSLLKYKNTYNPCTFKIPPQSVDMATETMVILNGCHFAGFFKYGIV